MKDKFTPSGEQFQIPERPISSVQWIEGKTFPSQEFIHGFDRLVAAFNSNPFPKFQETLPESFIYSRTVKNILHGKHLPTFNDFIMHNPNRAKHFSDSWRNPMDHLDIQEEIDWEAVIQQENRQMVETMFTQYDRETVKSLRVLFHDKRNQRRIQNGIITGAFLEVLSDFGNKSKLLYPIVADELNWYETFPFSEEFKRRQRKLKSISNSTRRNIFQNQQ